MADSETSAVEPRVGQRHECFDVFYLTCEGHYTPAGDRLAAGTVATHLRAKIDWQLATRISNPE